MKTIFTCLLLLVGLSAGNIAAAQCQASFTASVNPNGGVTFTNTSTPANLSGATWTFGDGTSSNDANPPVHYYNTAGWVLVCLTVWDSASNCQSAWCDTITLNNSALCQASWSYQNAGLQYYFYGYLQTATGGTATYTWDFGDGTVGTGASPQHTYANAGTYNVCVTATTAAGCSDSYCNAITATSGITCNANFSAGGNGVFGGTIMFTNLSSGNNNYSWDFGDGSTSSDPNPTHIYAPGYYIACLTIGTPVDSCYDIHCDSIYIPSNTPTCSATFGYQNTGNTFHFNSNAPLLNHSWSFGDGTYAFTGDPYHTYAGPGTYQVCHTVSDPATNCTDTYCTTITITSAGNCIVSYTFVADTTGTIFAFTGNITSGTTGQLVWSFGDGTSGTGNQVTHAYNNNGWYLVCVSAVTPNGALLCTHCDSLLVGNPANICVPTFYSFPDSSVIGNGTVYFGVYNPCGNTQYVWNFGDSTTGSGSNPSHMYADSGWYYVCVTAYTSGGTFSSCDSVYSLRLSNTTAIAENASSIGLNVYPNPMHGAGTASFMLKQSSMVIINLYDVQGKVVSVVYEGSMDSGIHKIALNNETLHTGIYILRINVNGTEIHQRIAVF